MRSKKARSLGHRPVAGSFWLLAAGCHVLCAGEGGAVLARKLPDAGPAADGEAKWWAAASLAQRGSSQVALWWILTLCEAGRGTLAGVERCVQETQSLGRRCAGM